MGPWVSNIISRVYLRIAVFNSRSTVFDGCRPPVVELRHDHDKARQIPVRYCPTPRNSRPTRGRRFFATKLRLAPSAGISTSNPKRGKSASTTRGFRGGHHPHLRKPRRPTRARTRREFDAQTPFGDECDVRVPVSRESLSFRFPNGLTFVESLYECGYFRRRADEAQARRHGKTGRNRPEEERGVGGEDRQPTNSPKLSPRLTALKDRLMPPTASSNRTKARAWIAG